QLVLVNVSVVDAIDGETTQHVIVYRDGALVMFEAERLEKILIDDDGAGRDDRVDHFVPDKIDNHLFEPGGDERAGEAENDRAILLLQHSVIDVCGADKDA